MSGDGTTLTAVSVLDEPGLYSLTSLGPTTYYVDSTNPATPRYMRWRGAGISLSSPMDNRWHDLIMLGASPDDDPDDADAWEWTLKVGCYHTYITTREPDHPNGPIYWVRGRVCQEIRWLESMPPEGARTRPDAWMPQTGLIILIGVAVQRACAWAVIVPEFPGCEVEVANLDDAADALASKAAALTGRVPADFIVSVRYVSPPFDEEQR